MFYEIAISDFWYSQDTMDEEPGLETISRLANAIKKEAYDSFAVLLCEDRVQPISGQVIAEWRADLTEILIQIIIRCKKGIMLRTFR